MEEKIRFGVAGCPPNFWKSPYGKDGTNSPFWLARIGLDAYEVQFTHGIRMTSEKALLVGRRARAKGIALSLHAPYFVVLTSRDEQVVRNSIETLIRCLEFASYLGTSKVVFHPGPHHGEPKEALEKCLKNLEIVRRNSDHRDISIYPETLGRKEYLGSLEDVVYMCKEMATLRPCIDFAHVYAREGGWPSEAEDFRKVLDYIAGELGLEGLRGLHCHFYPVEFDNKGERCHKNFKNTRYGPRFEPFLETVLEYDLRPTIISESKEAQDEDALRMKGYYLGLLNRKRLEVK